MPTPTFGRCWGWHPNLQLLAPHGRQIAAPTNRYKRCCYCVGAATCRPRCLLVSQKQGCNCSSKQAPAQNLVSGSFHKADFAQNLVCYSAAKPNFSKTLAATRQQSRISPKPRLLLGSKAEFLQNLVCYSAAKPNFFKTSSATRQQSRISSKPCLLLGSKAEFDNTFATTQQRRACPTHMGCCACTFERAVTGAISSQAASCPLSRSLLHC